MAIDVSEIFTHNYSSSSNPSDATEQRGTEEIALNASEASSSAGLV